MNLSAETSQSSKPEALFFQADADLPDGDPVSPSDLPNISDSEVSGGASGGRDRELYADMTTVFQIYRVEAARCAVMLLAFGIALAHLYAYEPLIGTDISSKHEIPEEELRFFHHGWTAMLTIFLVEFCSMSLKVWTTWHSPVLAAAIAHKFEGSIGVLFGEYIVVGATYVIMAGNWMPVFLEARTGRRVYGVRYMEWAVDACGLVFLDCFILFSQPFKQFYMAFVWSVAYVMLGLWSAIAPTWPLYWAFLAASWLTFFFVCFMLIRFLHHDPKPAQPFSAGVKPCILAFIIIWWVFYGVLFMVEFGDYVPQWAAQFLWTGMDVIMKLSHTVVLMAWRASQWDIDAVVKRHKAEGEHFVVQLDKERAVRDRDRLRLLAKVHTRKLEPQEGGPEAAPGPEPDPVSSQVAQHISFHHDASVATSKNLETTTNNDLSSLGTSHVVNSDVSSCFHRVMEIYRREFFKCLVLCVAFILSLLHLYIYPEVFKVQVLHHQDVPEDEMHFFHHGWTSMLVVFLIEALSMLLKVSGTWHQPYVALTLAQKFEGNIGALFGEYLVVGATYVLMGYNLMPVFVEPRTGRRVYAVRYMEWLVDACGLISLDCHCLFNRSFAESRMAFVWTIAYMLFGLWSALASTWLWYWVFLCCSWLTFFLTCGILVHFLWKDPYPLEPFGKKPVKSCILTFIIVWWILYGVLFMVSFQAPELMPQWLEQLLWTGMDVVMKLSHTIILIAWRETQWDMDTVDSRRKAVMEKKRTLREIRQIRKEERQFQQQTQSREKNWTSTPGLAVGVPEMVMLMSEAGQGHMSDGQLRSMMSPEEFAELQRLEKLGLSHAQLQARWEGQMREQTFLRQGVLNINYNPDHWGQTLLGLHGRAGGSYPCWIVIAVALAVDVFREWKPDVAETFQMTDKIHSLLGGSVMFLVVFRTQYAFRKWWDGRAAFGKINLYSRTLGQQVCAYVLDDELCKRAVKYLIAAVVATCCHLRHVRVDSCMLVGILRDEEIKELNSQPNMPYYATWMIRSTIATAVQHGKFLPLQMAMDNSLRAMEEAIADAQRLLTPMPFMYVAHLRSFLFLYLLFLPFVLIEKLGHSMVLAVALASYLLIGLENTAVTMENPFGYEMNDLPLDLYCIEASRDLLGCLELRVKRNMSEKGSTETSDAVLTAAMDGGDGDD